MSLLKRWLNCRRSISFVKFSLRNLTMSTHVTMLSQQDAIKLDQDLFNECNYSVDQLMELAGLSVATSICRTYPVLELTENKVLICCGPGNNGGDGLVAARHLCLFGYKTDIYYPKAGKSELFERLVKQCKDFNITFLDALDVQEKYPLIVDAIFGFSYKPPLRPEFQKLLEYIVTASNSGSNVVSVDIPSGWHVETGPQHNTPVIKPDCLISLTAPKRCASHFTGRYHWLGGRFVPPTIVAKYNLDLPSYLGYQQCVCLSEP